MFITGLMKKNKLTFWHPNLFHNLLVPATLGGRSLDFVRKITQRKQGKHVKTERSWMMRSFKTEIFLLWSNSDEPWCWPKMEPSAGSWFLGVLIPSGFVLSHFKYISNYAVWMKESGEVKSSNGVIQISTTNVGTIPKASMKEISSYTYTI